MLHFILRILILYNMLSFKSLYAAIYIVYLLGSVLVRADFFSKFKKSLQDLNNMVGNAITKANSPDLTIDDLNT